MRSCGDLFQSRNLILLGGDDQLAQLSMWNPVLAAIGIEPLAPGDATCRLEAASRVVDPAVDDFAVARGGLEPDRPGALQHKHLAAGERQCPCRREPDHSGADHDAFDLVHCSSPPSFVASRSPTRPNPEGAVVRPPTASVKP